VITWVWSGKKRDIKLRHRWPPTTVLGKYQKSTCWLLQNNRFAWSLSQSGKNAYRWQVFTL